MAVRPFDEIFRDFVINGLPASGPHHPPKADIRDSLNAIVAGPFPDNRVIKLNNANEGTENNIVVSASVAIPTAVYQVLYILNVTQENTGPVTISGAINRKLVTNTSEPVPAGYLKPGMAVLCIDTGSELRMLSYGDVEKAVEDLVQQAEAAVADAELAKDQAQNAASDAVSQGSVPIYSTRNAVEALEIPAGINAIRTNGYVTVGDGGGGLYRRVPTANPLAHYVQSGDGAYWQWVPESKAPLSHRRVLREFGFRDNIYDAIKSTYGYAYLYPQAAALDKEANQLFIYKNSSGGSNAWAWVWVYDWITGDFIRAFSFGTGTREGIVVRWNHGQRYLYVTNNDSTIIRANITTLPANNSRLSAQDTFSVNSYSFLGYSEGRFLSQINIGGQMRNVFSVLDADLDNASSRITIPVQYTGTITSYINVFPKAQGVCLCGGLMHIGYGAAVAVDQAGNDADGYLCGTRSFSLSGTLLEAALHRPDDMASALEPVLGYRPTLCESEGVFSADGTMYSMWITLNISEREDTAYAGRGVVIMEEQSDAPDALVVPIIIPKRTVDTELWGTRPAVAPSQLSNPFDDVVLESFDQIIDMMIDGDIKTYRFYGTNQSLVDINNDIVKAGGREFIFKVLSAVTVDVEIIGANSVRSRMRITGASGNRVQSWSVVGVNTDAPAGNGDNFINLGVSNEPVIDIGRSGSAHQSHIRFINDNGGVGFINTLGSSTRYYFTLGAFITGGPGSPEGAVSAPVGSLFLRTDGGVGATLFVKESGTGNTGWVAK